MKITIKSNLFPDIEIDTKKPVSEANAFAVKVLQPEIQVEGITVYSPHGKPQYGSFVFYGICAILALLLWRGTK